MLIFLIVAVLLALVLQQLLTGKDLQSIESDHRPDLQVAEPDEPFHILVILSNKSRRFVPFLRVCESFGEGLCPTGCTEPRDDRGNCKVEFTTWLRPRQSLIHRIPLTASRRGRYVLHRFRLSCGDFLGLREREELRGHFREVVVAPRPLCVEGMDELFGGFLGEVSVRRFILEDPVLTLGYREYTGREPMKMISWAQSARGQGLMVKKYDYTLEPAVSVLLNVDGGDAEQLETCFSLARAVCAQLEERGVKYAFTSNCVLAGISSDPGATGEGLGQRHFRNILEHLGRATYQHSVPMERLLEQEAARGAAAGCILITPGGEGEPARAIGRLREASGGCLLVLRAAEVTP